MKRVNFVIALIALPLIFSGCGTEETKPADEHKNLEQIQDKVDDLKEQIKDSAPKIRENIQDRYNQAKEKLKDYQEQFKEEVQE